MKKILKKMSSSHPVGWAVWKTSVKKRCQQECGEAGTISTVGGIYNGIAARETSMLALQEIRNVFSM